MRVVGVPWALQAAIQVCGVSVATSTIASTGRARSVELSTKQPLRSVEMSS